MRGALILTLALAGCSGGATAPATGPAIFECVGMLKKVAAISLESEHRTVIRLDGKAKTFAEWSRPDQVFTDWPGGRMTVGAEKMTFTGSQRDGDREARRSLTFDLASGHLSDRIDVGADGRFEYEATCSPRPTAPNGKAP